jgi:hypothetical protein
MGNSGKQKKSLSSEQIAEIQAFIFISEDLVFELLKKYSLTFLQFKRMVTASGLKIPFGYSYAEYLTNTELQSNYNKSNIKIDCSCGKVYITKILGFNKRKYKKAICDICYRKTYMYDDEWKINNSKAQKIAQNRPETLEKQINSQKLRYSKPGVKEHYREIGKKLWENPEYRKKIIANSSISKSGIYHNLTYQSSIELAFILWCEANDKNIKNYSLGGIPYLWNGNIHHYYPDFIVDETLIVEIKCHTGIYFRDYEKNQTKFTALREWCKDKSLNVRIVFDTDLGNRAIKKARQLHDTLNKEKNNSIQG